MTDEEVINDIVLRATEGRWDKEQGNGEFIHEFYLNGYPHTLFIDGGDGSLFSVWDEGHLCSGANVIRARSVLELAAKLHEYLRVIRAAPSRTPQQRIKTLRGESDLYMSKAWSYAQFVHD